MLASAIAISRMDPIRVRAAWTLRVGQPTDFEWAPTAPPASFALETAPPTREFVAITRQIARGDDLETAEAAARYVASYVEPESPTVPRGVSATLRAMHEGGLGFCSDVSQVFVGLTSPSSSSSPRHSPSPSGLSWRERVWRARR
jgi:hypothetical protein